MPTARTWNLAQWSYFWRSVGKKHRTARATQGAWGKGPLLATTVDHCCLNAGLSVITRTVFKVTLCKGWKGRQEPLLCFGWEKKLCSGKWINQYKDAGFTMVKYACYSEHLHYKRKHWRESCRRKDTHFPPVPEPFWTPLYNHFGCSDTHAKLLKSGQGEKGNLSHPLPGGFDNFHIQISTW